MSNWAQWQALVAAILGGLVVLIAAAWNRGWEARLALADKRTDLYLSEYRRLHEISTLRQRLRDLAEQTGGAEASTGVRQSDSDALDRRIGEAAVEADSLVRRLELAPPGPAHDALLDERDRLEASLDDLQRESESLAGGVNTQSISDELRSLDEQTKALLREIPEVGRMLYLASPLAIRLAERSVWAVRKWKSDGTRDMFDEGRDVTRQAVEEFVVVTSREVRNLRRSLPFRLLWQIQRLWHGYRLKRRKRREGW